MNKEFLNMFKNKHIQTICLIFIIGVVLMIGAGRGTQTKIKPDKETKHQSDEERLSMILSEIKGAGDVSVMITYYGTAQKDIAYETKTNTVGRESGNEESEDKKAVMTGDVPMVVKETYPEVKGVIVAAEGAKDIAVREAISEAVVAVLDVPAHRVCIYQKEE